MTSIAGGQVPRLSQDHRTRLLDEPVGFTNSIVLQIEQICAPDRIYEPCPPANRDFLRRGPGFDTPRAELATVKCLRRLADDYEKGLIGAQALRRGVRRVRTPEVDCIGAPPHPEGLEGVHCWRHDYARRLGFDEPEAALIAHRAEIDTHVLERLIRRGCVPYLALEIVR